MSHFWATAPAYPAPRRRAVAPPGTAPADIAAGGFAIGSGDSRPFRARNWVFYLEFSAAGFGREVSPQLRGPALIKRLEYNGRANIGNPTTLRLLISPSGSGAQVTSVGGAPPSVPGDRLLFDSNFRAVASTAVTPGLVDAGTSAGTFAILLDQLVEDEAFFLAAETDNTQAGTIATSGHVLIYEAVRLDQLALLVG
jgi:hypothetical protein